MSKDEGTASTEAKGKKKAKRAKKEKQAQIPGTERPDRIDGIETAAAAYVEVRDERMELTKQEVKAKTILHDAMKKAGLVKYSCDSEDLEVEIVPAKDETVKVKRRKIELEDDGAGDDE